MDLQFILSPLIFLVFFFFLFKLIKEVKKSPNTQKSAQKFPPGPWKLPLIGNILHLAGSLPHHALQDLAKKHGPLMHLQLGEISAIVISSPRVAKQVLKTHDLAFADRPELLASKIMAYNNTDITFAPYGDYWRQMRKICTLELLSAKNVRAFSSIREDEACHLIDNIQSASGSVLNLSEKVYSFTNAVVCRAAFGERCKEQDMLIQLINESISLAGGFDVADLFPSLKLLHFTSGLRPKLLKIHQTADQILDYIFKEHMENLASCRKGNGEAGDEDLVDVLLRVKQSGRLEFPITFNNIKAVLLDMFTAGTETSSTTVVWAMSELMRNPKVMRKVQDEMRQALNGKKTLHEVDIHGLSYLKLVIKETLRLHPPVPLLLPRECKEMTEIEGYNIPVKTKVIVNAWAIGRDPEFWSDAISFKPERFENCSIDLMGNNFEYIPFGAGRRMCPGVSFGLANVELPLAQLLYHFNWTLPGGIKPEDLDMSETMGATAGRKNNLYLIASMTQADLVEI